MSDLPATQMLADRAVEARRAQLPVAALAAAESVLYDWCGVAIGGGVAAPAKMLRSALAGGGGPARLVAVSDRAEPATAALINGTAAHTLELDDIYAPGTYHPGAPTVAAALAVAQSKGADGIQLLRGIVIGFEVGNRVAQTLGPDHYAYWHTTGTAGSLAAAAAVAEVLSLDAEQFANALAIASTMAAGLQQTFRTDSMGKPLHSGHAAQNGVIAGLSAAEGFTGTLDVLDGGIGMGVVMSSSPSWVPVGEPFGPSYLIEQTTVKPYPCCGHTFAAVDAALDLRRAGVDVDEVAGIDIHTYAAAIQVAGNPAPATTYEAKFSLPFVVACALKNGRLGADAFTDAVLDDDAILQLMTKVTLHSDEDFTSVFPNRRGARVEVLDNAGARHSETVPDRRGDPANPVTPEQMEEKFSSLVTSILGDEGARELEAQIRSATELGDVRSLRLGPC